MVSKIRFGTACSRGDRYEPFDPSSVYYDDIAEVISDKIAHYNRIALIVQGLFDRSGRVSAAPNVEDLAAGGFPQRCPPRL